NKVTIYNRKNKAKCIPALYELFKKNGAIEYKTDHILDSITAPSMKLHLSFENGYETIVDYVVFAIGRVPKLDYLSESLKNNMDSLIENSKLFLVGDVKNGNFRQASIAVGSGIEAAMKINSFLNESTT
ncbi:MAG: hypothetical protein GY855_13090, partial [candidate division Zixibacteria bacterium]|nr:hypothetical protein [candidate division Zixibacteria bacterium]